tara:strand:+ start:4861 stop:5244 length:384 start_codon:yes stop_codon:yes gene_type:complete
MLEYVIGFFIGVALTYVFSYLVAIGHSIIVLKQAQKSCAALLIISEQGLREVLQLKYLAMEEASRSTQNITAQKYIDELNISSVRKSIMRNHISVFPRSYSNILEYSTWEEMEQYVNETIQQGDKIP